MTSSSTAISSAGYYASSVLCVGAGRSSPRRALSFRFGSSEVLPLRPSPANPVAAAMRGRFGHFSPRCFRNLRERIGCLQYGQTVNSWPDEVGCDFRHTARLKRTGRAGGASARHSARGLILRAANASAFILASTFEVVHK